MMLIIVGSPPAQPAGQKSGSKPAITAGEGDPRTFGKQVVPEELKWGGMNAEELAALASTPALFGGAQTFILRGALADPERGEAFLDMARAFAESPHTFIFEEEKLLKAPTDILKAAGAKIEINKVEKKERGFDPFGLSAALGARDRKKLWLALTAALGAGEKPEAVAGLFAWKIRSLLEGRASNYTREELANLSRTVVFLYHDSHRGAGDLELLLERFALTL